MKIYLKKKNRHHTQARKNLISKPMNALVRTNYSIDKMLICNLMKKKLILKWIFFPRKINENNFVNRSLIISQANTRTHTNNIPFQVTGLMKISQYR